MLQNLRIGLKKRQNGKSDVPVKQRGSWPKYPKIKEKTKTTVFSLSENWCLPAPSTLKPEESEFVVDSRAETVTTSRSPTTVFAANGEVQTHEEAAVYVKELENS